MNREKFLKNRRFYENRTYQERKDLCHLFGSMIGVRPHNIDLEKRLTAFEKEHPQCCRQINDDEQGGLTFEIEKGRWSFQLTSPYGEDRKKAASEWAKMHGISQK
jgi:hypothetical protein